MATQEKVNILLVDDQPGKLLAYEAKGITRDELTAPGPDIAAAMPLLIGGSGRKRTLKVVARWAQKWDGGFGSPSSWRAERSSSARASR